MNINRYNRNVMVRALAGGDFVFAMKYALSNSFLCDFYTWLKKRDDWFSIR